MENPLMKFSYTNNKFGNAPIDHLSARIKGTACAVLTDDNCQYEINIKNSPHETETILEPTTPVLRINFSEGVRLLAYEKLASLDAEFLQKHGLPSGGPELAVLYVPYSKLSVVYASLLAIDPTITNEQMRELRSFLNPHKPENQLSKQQRLFSDPTITKNQLMARFEAEKNKMDAGTVKLITDLNAQPASTEINTVMRKALLGSYHDFASSLALPKLTLIEHLQQANASNTLIENVTNGCYDNNPSQQVESPGTCLKK